MGSYIKMPGGSGLPGPIKPSTIVLIVMWCVISLELVELSAMWIDWYHPPTVQEVNYDLEPNKTYAGGGGGGITSFTTSGTPCLMTNLDGTISSTGVSCVYTGNSNVAIGNMAVQETKTGDYIFIGNTGASASDNTRTVDVR